MQNGTQDPTARIRRARNRAGTAARLTWTERVLLAAAEAADATVAPRLRSEVACAVADKAAIALHEAQTVRALRLALIEALASSGVEALPGGSLHRFTWRLVFDLWGGPDR